MKKFILSLSFLLLMASTYAQSFSKKGSGGSDNWGSQVVVHTGCLTGSGVAGDSLDVASGCITPSKLDRTYLTAEVDGSVTNELQDLSLSGNTLSLTGDATTVSLAAYVNTDNQTLSISNDTLSISGGNLVILPTGTVVVNDTITDAQTTISTSFTDITNGSITFPSAGTWQVSYEINYVAASNTQSSSFRMITNTGTVIGNSCIKLEKASSQTFYNASRSFFVTVTSSVTYKLQWRTGAAANTMTIANNKTDTSCSISALRIR